MPEPASVYRLGGDEFVVVVPSAESETAVSRLAARLGEAMDGRYEAAEVPVTLAASVGSTYGPADEVEKLLRIADSNMYQHKARRRSGGVLSPES